MGTQLVVRYLLFSVLVCGLSLAADKHVLDNFNAPHECKFLVNIAPSNPDCSGPVGGSFCVVSASDCASAKDDPTFGMIGGSRETYITLVPGVPRQDGDECGTTVFDNTGNANPLYSWSTFFSSETGGYAEYTLDGVSDPTTISTNVLSEDLTAFNEIAFHIAIYVQFDTPIDFYVFDNNNVQGVKSWQLIGGGNTIVFSHYLIPYSEVKSLNTSLDLTRVGALDFGLSAPVADDTVLVLFNTFAHDISGFVFRDCGNVCVFDVVSDAVLSGVTVQLFDNFNNLADTDITDANGRFSFAVDAGTWEVCVVTPGGGSPVNGCANSNGLNPLNGCVTFTIGVPGRDWTDPFDPTVETNVLQDISLQFGYTFGVVVNVPNDVTIECGTTTSPSSATTVGTATAVSSCSGNPLITFQDSVTPGCGGTSTITRTWTATSNGQSDSDIQIITVRDTINPAFVSNTFPTDRTVTCNACTAATTNCLGVPSATDSCSLVTVTPSDSTRIGSTSCLSITDRTWTAQDACNNFVTRTQVFTVQDRDSPSFIFFPDTVTVDCSADISNPVTTGGAATADDLCNDPTFVTFTDVVGTPGCRTVVTRTWTALDACNNPAVRTQTINKQDRQAPTLIAPADTAVSCESGASALDPSNTGIPFFSDDCSSTLPTYSDTATVPCQTITRTWSISDGCNPTVTTRQLILYADPTPPDFVNFPADATVSCSSSANLDPSRTGRPSARDDCSGVRSISYTDSEPIGSCTATIDRTWTAINNCGLPNSEIQQIFVTDNTPPTLVLPPNQNLDCEESTDPSNTGGIPDVTDLCSATLAPVRDDDISGNSCVTTIRRSWTVSDVCNNVTPAQTQIIVLRDTTAPQFVGFPTDITIGCLESTDPSNTGAPNFSDDCSLLTTSVTYRDADSAADCPNLSAIIRTWTVSDGCNNSNTRTQRISIEDDQPPVIVAPADITIPCESSTSPSVTGLPDVVNGCGSLNAPVSRDVTSTETCPTTITRTWSVSDVCGASDSDIQIITLTDNKAPEFLNVPDDIFITCADNIPGIADDSDFTISDNCDPNPTITYSDFTQELEGVGLCPGDTIISRTFRASDNCGNTGFYTQTITISNVPPTECSPVDCTPSPCDPSSCPNQDCDCCGADPVPCQPTNCQATSCTAVPCTAIPCSGCDVVPVSNGCQPKLCAPTYIFIDDDDVLSSNRGGLKQVIVENPKVSGSAQLVVSTLLVIAAFASVFVALF